MTADPADVVSLSVLAATIVLLLRFQIRDLLGDNVGIREVVGGFEGVVLEPEDVKAGLVPSLRILILLKKTSHLRTRRPQS